MFAAWHLAGVRIAIVIAPVPLQPSPLLTNNAGLASICLFLVFRYSDIVVLIALLNSLFLVEFVDLIGLLFYCLSHIN